MFATHAFLHAVPWVIGAVALVLAATFVAGRVVGKHAVIDIAWGAMFAAAALAAFLTSSGHGDPGRRWLLAAMTVIWGGRLATHIGLRSRGKPEDPRYEKMLAGKSPALTFALVYGLQGVLVLIVALPVYVGPFESGDLTGLAFVGLTLWAVGVTFEAVGDWQLERYKRDPYSGPVMDRGLWRYTRHPNYFGDACVWVGLYLVAAERWPGPLTLVSPVVMVYLLVFGSGKRLLEQSMFRRTGYAEYMARTSGFLPLPPRARAISRPR